ncbi:MAG: cytochrome c-type biosis protein CcmF [Miltoncostaeaceae bacterium]|jgi:cytochrome c-type biogenesis protein CcmF|nr:cytochrome c-type biosis protein CcmF [Miltoncostaeaceae bacterium]
MSLLGRGVVLLAFGAALYAVVMALSSRRHGQRAYQRSAERAVYAFCALLTLAMGTLWAGLLTNEFVLRNVADSTSRSLGWPFKLSALWSSQAGSLLLWAWMLSCCAAIVVRTNRARNRELMPVVVAVLMGTGVFFTSILTFVTSPFETLATVPADGRGLNPLLQNPYMVIHPPMLYVGYVSLAVPFAFAIAALVTGRLDTAWITSVRRWTIVAWLFLGLGILLGARWAYQELGWGGYWAWDPVENAAFMPWLAATAFLHSVMVQERRGMLKVWNMALVTLCFSLALFGTFLTRSGVLSSVHAFGESTLGPYFLAFIAVVLAGSVALIVSRLPLLRSQHSLESYLSREAVFLFNNLLLIGLAFAVFWGTVFPIISEAVQGTKRVVGQPYFNQVSLPIGLGLLLLTGVGPLIAWRKASPAQLRRRFAMPLAVAAVAAVLLGVLTDAWSRWAAGAVFTTSVFVVACIAGEFWRGMRVQRTLGGVSWPGALLRLVGRNRRRYGGYLVHIGIVVLFVGLAGSKSFASGGELALRQGEAGNVGGYTFVNRGPERMSATPHVANVGVGVAVLRDGRPVGVMHPGFSIYANGDRATEVAIDTTATRDIYVVLSSFEAGGIARISVFVNPLVIWIWAAGVILAIGALIAGWPGPRVQRRAAPAAARAPARPAEPTRVEA